MNLTTKRLTFLFIFVSLVANPLLAEVDGETRTWTDDSGKTITATLVDYDGTTVTVTMKGKKYKLPENKLSEEDQNWLKKREKEQEQRLASLLGLHKKVPIITRYGTTTDEYFVGPFGKNIRRFYDTQVSICDDTGKGLFMKCDESVAWEDETMLVYCPKSYKGNATPIGIYINISAGDSPIAMKPGYDQVMDRRNLIYASPSGTSNKRSDVRRMALVLDTLATLRKNYRVDAQRIFVGGVSGGGAMSAWITVYFPEFRGAICQVRNAFIPHNSCFPTVEQSDVRGIARRKQAFAWVTGSKDFNRKHILESAPTWDAQKFVSKVFDIPGMGHSPAPAKALEDALTWAEESSAPPRQKK